VKTGSRNLRLLN